jgi:hypothetical protein
VAIVTRYFSTTGAGAANGTTWADRAALFSAGNWSTIITGHDFSADSLVAYVGPGSYTCSQALTTTTITTDPTVATPFIARACDSSGVAVNPPDPHWESSKPAWDDSTCPVIATTTNIATLTLPFTVFHMIKLTASGRQGAVVSAAAGVNTLLSWCVIEQNTSHTSAQAVNSGVRAIGCVFKCTQSAYDSIYQDAQAEDVYNCRIEGVTGATGNRYGISVGGSTCRLNRVTVVNCGGGGVVFTSASTGVVLRAFRCTIANNGGAGILLPSTASQLVMMHILNCMITGNGTYGIDAQSGARVTAMNNRLRDNATANFNGFGNYPTDLNNYTTDSDDATEYVSTGANGDFRIKNTATNVWQKGYGAGEEAPAAGGGGSAFPVIGAGGLVL